MRYEKAPPERGFLRSGVEGDRYRVPSGTMARTVLAHVLGERVEVGVVVEEASLGSEFVSARAC